MAHRKRVLNLYTNILRIHREKLPSAHRALGDSYVKKEFRDHVGLSPTEPNVESFLTEWEKYYANTQAVEVQLGGSMRFDNVDFDEDDLSDEQRIKLAEMAKVMTGNSQKGLRNAELRQLAYGNLDTAKEMDKAAKLEYQNAQALLNSEHNIKDKPAFRGVKIVETKKKPEDDYFR